MGFYKERIIPWLIHLSMRQRMLAPYRDRVVSSARGRVLEVGIGSGLNLPFYTSAATEIIGLDPSPKLLEIASKTAQKTPIALRLVEGTAEAIPIEDHHVDAVVTTWTMCSIPEIQRALQEMRRVLRPAGRLFFVGRASRLPFFNILEHKPPRAALNGHEVAAMSENKLSAGPFSVAVPTSTAFTEFPCRLFAEYRCFWTQAAVPELY
jgi:ubiquinone/menaquinone biosynthesis C-methylase UbiE